MANAGDPVQNESFAQEIRKFLFYSKSFAKPDGEIEENDSLRAPVGVFRVTSFPNRHFAATWNHGEHENIKEGSTMNIYNEDGDKFETKVIFKGSVRDYLVLESDEKLVEDVPYISSNGYRDGIEKALPGDALLKPSFLPGIVTSQVYDKNGHYGGTSAEMPGFSGGPAYQKFFRNEFLGLCLKGAQCYQIVAGHSMESAIIYLVGYEKQVLKETKETEETEESKCSIL